MIMDSSFSVKAKIFIFDSLKCMVQGMVLSAGG
jgi:hypothetical protein